MLVPVGALVRERDGWAAWVDDHGRARRRALAVGPRNDDVAVVERGLAPGERVVVYPPAARGAMMWAPVLEESTWSASN